MRQAVGFFHRLSTIRFAGLLCALMIASLGTHSFAQAPPAPAPGTVPAKPGPYSIPPASVQVPAATPPVSVGSTPTPLPTPPIDQTAKPVIDTPMTTAPTGAASMSSPNEPGKPKPSEVIDVIPVEKESRRTLALFRTSMGNFTVLLFTKQAPRTTKNFIELAKGEKEFLDVKSGRKVMRPFYNGLIFHRVMKNFIIQSGCPLGTSTGNIGYTIQDEFTPALRHRKAGTVSMAGVEGQPNSNDSQFLITLGPQPEFDDKYTVFGEVIQGMDVVYEISRVKVGPTNRPLKRVYIIAIDIVEEEIPQ